MTNLSNWLISIFLLYNHFTTNIFIHLGLPKAFCMLLNLSINCGLNRQISDYQQYTLQHNLVTTLVRSVRATYENDIASKVQTNPRAYVNQTAKVKPSIGMLERKDAITTVKSSL